MFGFSQTEINWLTWEQAIEASKNDKKKVFVDVYTDWCGWCKKMDATTFKDSSVVNYMNTYFYAIKFNAETKDEIKIGSKTYKSSNTNKSRAPHELAQELLQGKLSYPTIIMLDENFNSLGPIPGFQSSQSLTPMLKFIGTDSYKSTTWENYIKVN